MGYYCTVPQCTSLAGKTKNVKFHRFPRDVVMADKWNVILKRMKPYTKYSKVCSLHFTQADYNVTTMGQLKTLSKDAIPSQNLPRLHEDGTVMVIRKSRSTKYREGKKDLPMQKVDKWPIQVPTQSTPHPIPLTTTDPVPVEIHDSSLAYRLQSLSAIATTISSPIVNMSSPPISYEKPKKQDAIMQTDPVQSEEDSQDSSFDTDTERQYPDEFPISDQYQKEPIDNSYSKNTSPYPRETLENPEYPKNNSPYSKENGYKETDTYLKDTDSYSKDSSSYPKSADSYPSDYTKESTSYQKEPNTFKDADNSKSYDAPKDYTKQQEDYIPQTNEEYNNEAEKYALERKSLNGYEKPEIYSKPVPIEYQKTENNMYPYPDKYPNRPENWYQNGYPDTVEMLRNQQHNLQILQEQHRANENQNFFNENHIKQEMDIAEEEFIYERTKNQIDANIINRYEEQRRVQQQRIMEHIQHQVKQEPGTGELVPTGCESVMLPQSSPYYVTSHNNVASGYYDQISRPGPELLIAKQNALAAHTQLWQNTMKRPFFYSENPHYNSPPLLHRYEDISRVLQ